MIHEQTGNSMHLISRSANSAMSR